MAGILADFIRKFDPKPMQCWMAERAAEMVESVSGADVDDDMQTAIFAGQSPRHEASGSAEGGGELLSVRRPGGLQEDLLLTQSDPAAGRHRYEGAG
jgi:hypothetical protein